MNVSITEWDNVYPVLRKMIGLDGRMIDLLRIAVYMLPEHSRKHASLSNN